MMEILPEEYLIMFICSGFVKNTLVYYYGDDR